MKEFFSTALLACAAVILVMLVLAIAGCASLGLWQMSEDWCQQHQDASANRCAGR